jgi:succinoglycan biosynthesis transport protein ExoP
MLGNNNNRLHEKKMNNMISQNDNPNGYKENSSYAGTPSAFDFMQESLIQIIWRSRWIMLACIMAALVFAFIYVSKATPIYTSTSTIYVEQSGPKIMTEMQEGVMTQSKNYLYTQATLLKSTPILASALEVPEIGRAQTFNRIDNPIAYLKKNVDTVVGKKDDVISVSFNSPYPAEASQIVNKVVESYITFQANSKRSTAAEVLKILRTEKEKSGKEFTEKLTAMTDFKMKNEALAFETSRGNMIVEDLARLSLVLNDAELDTIQKKSVYDITREMVNDPLKLRKFIEAQKTSGLYITNSREEDLIKQKLDQLELELEILLRQVKAGHPLVIEKQTEIEHGEQQLAVLETQFVQAQLAVAEQDYISAKKIEEELALKYEEQRQEVIKLNQQFAKYTLLQSEWELAKKQCDLLDERIKVLNVTEDVGALNISILEVARAASAPTEPQKARVMAIALMLGLMAGGGIALLRGWMDQKLHSAEEISAVLGVPVLGVVPSMSKKQDVSERGLKVHRDSQSTIAEAYRTIRTAVFFGAPKGETKTILITSPAPSDGKTTLVSNLGIAMAQAGQKTLIIDADFRKPMQHKIFQVNHEERGLSSVLAGMLSSKEAIHRTEVEGLELLTCGPEVPNPSEMLNSESFTKLLEYLCEKYDRIIIDSPPVMPVTDAQIVAAVCDITLLVLRAEKSTRKISQQARDGLLSVGAHLLGAVVNDVPKRGRYGYYSGYGNYYSYYGYGDKRRKSKNTDVIKPAAIDNISASHN